MNITEHPIYLAIYNLCLEIEKLPASEQATKCVTMATALNWPAERLVTALKAIASYDEQPIWTDDHDDSADDMLEIAREALK